MIASSSLSSSISKSTSSSSDTISTPPSEEEPSDNYERQLRKAIYFLRYFVVVSKLFEMGDYLHRRLESKLRKTLPTK